MTTLVILAAGRGSRFGGAKQFNHFGELNRTLMEYNICHAYDAGFKNIIFIIQQAHEKRVLKEIIPYLPLGLKASIIIQSLENIPNGCTLHKNRTKPLGTAHALWCAKNQISESFAVINADDYYGVSAFKSMINSIYNFPNQHLLQAFRLKNTLSVNGSVNRGICKISAEQFLIEIKEYEQIHQHDNQLSGQLKSMPRISLSKESLCSMNCWLFNPDIFNSIEENIITNLKSPHDQECYLPEVVMTQIAVQNKKVKVMISQDEWFGLTYQEDREQVEKKINLLTKAGSFSSLTSI